ncbi:MAG: hypothetical protein A2W00_11890 [Candidatus Eisenbacteria bacterium RBG_16_71_46]|nr:MAG: hypothetical protein A2W00_11890 [Candidatus Eisenbacteria bacterium RBG_16_71_46]
MTPRLAWWVSALLLLHLAAPVTASTARDLSGRMRLDGFTDEYTAGEVVFGRNAAAGNVPEEADDDSKWGTNNDIRQLRITWDAKHLYLAGEGNTWDNNMVLLLDTIKGHGLRTMRTLNSWRRNFTFDTTGFGAGRAQFMPDLFSGTWDGNVAPRLLIVLDSTTVDDQVPGTLFQAAATFLRDQPNRAMELVIPWRTVFLASAGFGTRDTVMTVGGVRDTFHLFPPGTRIRVAGVVTAGGDGSGGPDAAPDNTRGMSQDSNAEEIIDNYAEIDLDRVDDTGAGRGGPDGVADWGIEPKERVSFRYPPPILGLRFSLQDARLDRPAFKPDLGDRIRFGFTLAPRLDPNLQIDQIRTVDVTANVFDMNGRFVRNLYIGDTRLALSPLSSDRDVWDGRDERGMLVTPGIYILRLVIEPNQSRITRAMVVVR